MHNRSLLRHTQRKHMGFLKNLETKKCDLCGLDSKSIMFHMLKDHKVEYEAMTTEQVRQLKVIDRAILSTNKKIKLQKKEELRKLDGRVSIENYLSYRESNFANQSKKNLQSRESILTNFVDELQKHKFQLNWVFEHTDSTEFINILKPYITNMEKSAATKSMVMSTISGFLKYVGDVSNQSLTNLIPRALNDLSTRINKEKNITYKKKRIAAMDQKTIYTKVKGCIDFYTDTIRPTFINLQPGEDQTHDRTDVYGSIMMYLCYSNGTRTSDLINIKCKQVENAEKHFNHFMVRIEQHKTSAIYGDRLVVLNETNHAALLKISKSFKPLGEYVFRSRDGSKLSVPNTLKYIYGFQHRKQCPGKLNPKHFRDAITDIAISKNMGADVATAMKHSLNTQAQSYAPRKRFEKEIQAIINMNQLQEDELQRIALTIMQRSREDSNKEHDTADPSTEQAGPSTEQADPSTEQADPSTVTAGPSTVTADPSTVTADPSTVTAGPSTVTAGPSTVIEEEMGQKRKRKEEDGDEDDVQPKKMKSKESEMGAEKTVPGRIDKKGRKCLTQDEKDQIKHLFKEYFENLTSKLSTDIVATEMHANKELFKDLSESLNDYGNKKYSKIFEYIRVTRKNRIK